MSNEIGAFGTEWLTDVPLDNDHTVIKKPQATNFREYVLR